MPYKFLPHPVRGCDALARAKDSRIATCKLLTLEKLAAALDVEVSDLYHWER